AEGNAILAVPGDQVSCPRCRSPDQVAGCPMQLDTVPRVSDRPRAVLACPNQIPLNHIPDGRGAHEIRADEAVRDGAIRDEDAAAEVPGDEIPVAGIPPADSAVDRTRPAQLPPSPPHPSRNPLTAFHVPL